MISTNFDTEGTFDYVAINDIKYSGTIEIDTIISTNFTVIFSSDSTATAKGFILNWHCLTQWEEWTPLGDGTCRETEGLLPPYHGPDLKYRNKYRQRNETCRKFFSRKSNKYIYQTLHTDY